MAAGRRPLQNVLNLSWSEASCEATGFLTILVASSCATGSGRGVPVVAVTPMAHCDGEMSGRRRGPDFSGDYHQTVCKSARRFSAEVPGVISQPAEMMQRPFESAEHFRTAATIISGLPFWTTETGSAVPENT